MAVDYEGRILAQADPGPGEKIVVANIDITALRAERERRVGHHLLSHLRTEAYVQARRALYPQGQVSQDQPLSIAMNNARIAEAKRKLPG